MKTVLAFATSFAEVLVPEYMLTYPSLDLETMGWHLGTLLQFASDHVMTFESGTPIHGDSKYCRIVKLEGADSDDVEGMPLLVVYLEWVDPKTVS